VVDEDSEALVRRFRAEFFREEPLDRRLRDSPKPASVTLGGTDRRSNIEVINELSATD
jgi:hypothetical protein